VRPAPKDQPKKGFPAHDGKCTQCGYCCYDFWCVIGGQLHRDKEFAGGVCPELLQDDDGTYHCNALLRFRGETLERIKMILDPGGGCGSTTHACLDAIINGLIEL